MDTTGHVQPSFTAGIDLASKPEDTGVCVIDWSTLPATFVATHSQKLTDEALLEVLDDPRVAKVAIDAPFGFPMAFVDALSTYQTGGSWLPLAHAELRFRATEHAIKALPRVQPLSAITDQLVWPAMRCARLLSKHALQQGKPVDRAGHGKVVEVYPAAALRVWGIGVNDAGAVAASYKGNEPHHREQRKKIIDALRSGAEGILDLPEPFVQRCVEDDDQLDALVCALIARAAVNDRLRPIPAGNRWAASREGWIALPVDGMTLTDALRAPEPLLGSAAAA